MTLQDKYLVEAAKAVAGEANESIDYSGYSDQDGNITTSDTSLTNEIGSRSVVDVSRSNRQITYSTTRSAANVVDTTNGDDIQEIGLFSDQTGSNMQQYVDVANINQTTDFDIELTQNVTVTRS